MRPQSLTVFVPGTPKPQGSKHARPIYRGRGNAREFTGKVAQVESAGDALKTWRDDIRAALLDEHNQPQRRFEKTPVDLELTFLVARPKGHYRTGRNAHILRDAAPDYPAGKPDVDKLARAVLDAIGSAGVWADDSQVVSLRAAKRYAETTQPPGCLITINPLENTR